MREMTEDIVLNHAAKLQASAITLEIVEAGIEIAKDEMVAMIEAKANRQNKSRRPSTTNGPINNQQGSACPIPHNENGNGIASACPVPHDDTKEKVQPMPDEIKAADTDEQPAFTHAAREHIELLAQQSAAKGKASAERASQLVENVALQVAERKGLNEVTPEFIAQMGKKLGYGHPASEKTYQLEFVWTAEALAKLEEVPDFCRDLTRWRVEWTAYKKNLGRLITPESMEVKYSLWGEVSDHIRESAEPRMPWTSEAEHRLEKVTNFVKGQVIQSVEGNARQMGCAEVTGEVLDRVIEKWRATGDFHEGRYGYK